jgi:outer membrane protease
MQQRKFGFVAGSVSLLALLTFAAVPDPTCAQSPSIMLPAETQAQAGAVAFSFSASIGQVGGTAYERVYAPSVRDFKVSELKWDLENVTMAGVQGRAEFGGRFRVNLGYWGAVSEGDGSMVDRDWLFLDADSEDEWTLESRHPDTTLDSGSMLDLNLDVRAFSMGALSVSGILGYKRDEWKWSARGGDYNYTWDYNGDGEITGDEYRRGGSFPDGKLVIEYRQQYEVPYLGLGCEGTWGPVRVQGHVLYSPWVSAEDHDYHPLRDTTFAGDFSGGDWFGADLSATWLFAARWYATAGVEYQKFDEIIGDVTESSPEGRFVYGDSGGMELETVMLLLGAGFRF